MPIKFKPITPTKLNNKAIRDNLRAGLNDTANGILLDFEAYTATWKHKVKFRKRISVQPTHTHMVVETSDDIFRYVNDGTPPHKIRARNKKSLAFPSQFTPKTRPGWIVSSTGSRGGNIVMVKEVNHPGTEGRHVVETLEKKWQLGFWRRMDKAMRLSAQLSGHAYAYK